MRKILVLGLIVMTLTGCETLRYAFNQTFPDQQDEGIFRNKDGSEKPVPQDNLLASADTWVKQHLW